MTLEKIKEDSDFIYGKDAIDYISDMMNCKTKIETREYSYTWSKKLDNKILE